MAKRIYTLGPHNKWGFLSWTTSREKAKTAWDVYWNSKIADSRLRQAMSAADYGNRYVELTGPSYIGAESEADIARRIESERPRGIRGEPRKVNIHDVMSPGGLDEAVRGINTTRFAAFDDAGVGYKDVPEAELDEYCPPFPERRK